MKLTKIGWTGPNELIADFVGREVRIIDNLLVVDLTNKRLFIHPYNNLIELMHVDRKETVTHYTIE